MCSLVLVRDAALPRHRAHPVTVGGPDGVIVRVLREVRAQLWPRHAATASRRVRAGPVHVSQHVVVHQVSALPSCTRQPVVKANVGVGDGGRTRGQDGTEGCGGRQQVVNHKSGDRCMMGG